MVSGDEYLTKEGFDKAMKKLEALKEKRDKISQEIATARGFGDISENAEYDAAKEAQAMNEERLAELESRLARAQIIDDKDAPVDKALLGTIVSLVNTETGEERNYTLVSQLESDPVEGKISVDSPVGKALIGYKVDDIVEITVPVGIIKYKIINIAR